MKLSRYGDRAFWNRARLRFPFMEALIDAGVHMGFPRRLAEQLVVQTLRGSIEYYRK